jgi:hypothetical protein
MERFVLSGCAIFFLALGLLAMVGCGLALVDRTGSFASDATATALLLNLGGIPAGILWYQSRRSARAASGSPVAAIPPMRLALVVTICLAWLAFLVYLFFRNFRMHLGL